MKDFQPQPSFASLEGLDLSSLADEDLLLLHAAGELPADAARALEVRLSNELELRERFEAIRSCEAGLVSAIDAGFAALRHDEDAASAGALRRTSAFMAKSVTELALARAAMAPVKQRRWRFNKWIVGSAAAAAALVGAAVWVSTADLAFLQNDSQTAKSDDNDDVDMATNVDVRQVLPENEGDYVNAFVYTSWPTASRDGEEEPNRQEIDGTIRSIQSMRVLDHMTWETSSTDSFDVN
ncbi:MAG: hypothetical protein QM770_11200 [Tepidisphaeraceae bacterium]